MEPRFFIFALFLLAYGISANDISTFAGGNPSFSQGPAEMVDISLKDCGWRSRKSATGKIKSLDGKEWIVPADTNFNTAPKATDLYNQCGGTLLRRFADLKIESLPLIEAGGDETFTAIIFADNYFEFYVNGKLLAVDAVPFTPFNSSVIRFKARRPFTVAVMGVDWEENLGLGSERGRGVDYHPGDAGFVATIRDQSGNTVSITDDSWRAQTFYIAPLKDRSCLKIGRRVRDSSACQATGVSDGNAFFAAHWQVPADWFTVDFDDSRWLQASVFTNDVVGVNNKPAFMNFRDLFDNPKLDAQFIWSSNLVLDNLVLMRKTVE
ncbi:MAG: hypothetical protein ACR2OW_02330 [Methyloligellaceae bacterium]